MSRALRTLAGVILLACGVLLALYGLFAILYRGEGGGSGDTYVTFAGHEVDAPLAGAVALTIALVAVATGIAVLRRARCSGARAGRP